MKDTMVCSWILRWWRRWVGRRARFLCGGFPSLDDPTMTGGVDDDESFEACDLAENHMDEHDSNGSDFSERSQESGLGAEDINPATGLPMMGSLDAGGNAYGFDNDDDWSVSRWED